MEEIKHKMFKFSYSINRKFSAFYCPIYHILIVRVHSAKKTSKPGKEIKKFFTRKID